MIWRGLWIDAIEKLYVYRSIVICDPPYYITDTTEDISEIKREIKSGFLHLLGKTLDKYLHVHMLFLFKMYANMTLHQFVGISIERLLRNLVLLHTLKKLHILFIDKIGQVSAAILETLDIIIQKIRGNSIFWWVFYYFDIRS